MSRRVGKGSHDDLEERIPSGLLLVCLASIGFWSFVLWLWST